MSGTDRIVIEGIGVVGGFGCGISDLSRALNESVGRPGILTLSTGSGPVPISAFPQIAAAVRFRLAVRLKMRCRAAEVSPKMRFSQR